MPAVDDVRVPERAASVARQCRRRSLVASVAFAAALIAVFLAVAIRAGSLLVVLAVGVSLVVAVRAPVFRTEGSLVLTTDADPDVVREEFRSATPPPLVFQWGSADAVRVTDGTAVYDLSSPLGLASVRMAVTARTPDDADVRGADVELTVRTDGRPWGTYRASIDDRDGVTAVTVEVASDRRFGLRRLPQQLVARRYRPAALSALGYAVEEYDSRFAL